MAPTEELRDRIVRLRTLLDTVTDQQARKAIMDAIMEAERDLGYDQARAQNDAEQPSRQE